MIDAYLFYDLETTGLQPEGNQILEIAAIAVSDKLDIRATFSICIGAKDLVLDPYVQKMHTESGLLTECALSSITLEQADRKLAAFVDQFYPSSEKIVLAGHSPHKVDQMFTEAYLPGLAHRLSHRVLDVGAMMRAFKRHGDPTFKEGEVLGHRALADAAGAHDEFFRLTQLWRQR